MLETAGENIVLTATLNNFESFMAFIDERLLSLEIDDGSKTKILTSCDEIIANTINYAYPNSIGNLEIIFKYEPGTISITFIDSGIPFNPLARADTDVSAPLEKREIGGLGILMIKNLMDEVFYEYENFQNRLTIILHLTGKLD